jgi:hypothetical protein
MAVADKLQKMSRQAQELRALRRSRKEQGERLEKKRAQCDELQVPPLLLLLSPLLLSPPLLLLLLLPVHLPRAVATSSRGALCLTHHKRLLRLQLFYCCHLPITAC